MQGPLQTTKTSQTTETASRVFMSHYGFVRQAALEVAPFRDLTDDIVNETFIRFTARSEHWNYEDNVRPLLYKIAKNVASEYWRRYLKELPTELAELEELAVRAMRETREQNSENDLESEMEQIRKCLAQLPEEHRILIEAHYFHKIPLTELAASKKLKTNTLQRMVSRIRAKIRRCVEKALNLARLGRSTP